MTDLPIRTEGKIDHMAPSGESPLFSIITASYQCREKLAVTIDSVLSQNLVDLEYLVIDGGSTDGTVDEIRRHGSALRWISEPDRGVYDALNKGIRHSRGKFLYFIGAGDTLRPGILRSISEDFQKLRLTGGYPVSFLYGDVFSESLRGVYGGHTNRFKIAIQNICHQAIFYDRRIFDELGDYDLKYQILADYEFNMRCLGSGRIRKCRLNRVIANYECAGLSSKKDLLFEKDQAALVCRHLGYPSLLFYKLRYVFPKFFERWVLPRMRVEFGQSQATK